MALTGTVVAGTVTGTVLAGTVVAVTGTGTKTGTVCKGANVNDNSHIKLCVFTRSVYRLGVHELIILYSTQYGNHNHFKYTRR